MLKHITKTFQHINSGRRAEVIRAFQHLKWPYFAQNLHPYSIIKIPLFFWGSSGVGSFPILVINLSSIKDGEVGNSQNSNIYTIIYIHSHLQVNTI